MELFLQLSKLQGTTSYFDENVGRVGVKSDTVLPPPHQPQFSVDQITLSQPGGADYAHRITTCLPVFQNFLRY